MLVAEQERLTWPEICARYPDVWVVVVDLKFENDDLDGEIESAVVLAHSKSRGECLRETKYLRPGEPAGHFFTGPIIAPGSSLHSLR